MSAALPAVSRLSPVVVRLLGHNPGPMTLQGTNTYLIGSGSRRLLLDAGEAGVAQYQQSLAATLASEQCGLASLVISHWHHDHIGGAGGVVQAQPQVVVHKFPRLEDQLDGLTISPLEDGQLLEVEGASCRVIHTPGHTTDHVMLYLGRILHEMLLQEVACCFSLKIHGMKNTCSTRDLLLKPSLRTRTGTLQRRLHPRRRNCGI